jgi:hypothetical protein
MKDKKVDLREQIVKSLEGEGNKCDRCGYREENTFPHYSLVDKKKIRVCSHCHVEEHKKEKVIIKKGKEVK